METFEERDFPLSGTPGSSSFLPAFEIPDLSSVSGVQSLSVISPAVEPSSQLPRAFPHLMEALYAELESVARLLADQPLASRSDHLNVIMHLIRASSKFRARLQHPAPQAGGHRQGISSIHSPTPDSCLCGRVHTPMPTFPREAPCYDPYCNFTLPGEPYHFPSHMAALHHATYPHILHHESRNHGSKPPESSGRLKHTQFWRVLFRRQVRTTNFVAPYGCHDPSAIYTDSRA